MSAKERGKRFRSFISKARIDTIQVLLPGPAAGTELRRRLQAQNRVYSIKDVGWEYYDGNFPLFEPDPPMTAEEMQDSIKKIMGRFYRFTYFFMIAFHIFSFPAIIFFVHNIQAGWKRWHRRWRNSILRFGGWVIVKEWMTAFKKDPFPDKLQRAKKHLRASR